MGGAINIFYIFWVEITKKGIAWRLPFLRREILPPFDLSISI